MLKTTTLILFAAALLLAPPAVATPVTYDLDTGNIQVQGYNTQTNELVFDETLSLSTNSFLEFDPTGTPTIFGLGTLDDFNFEIDPNQGPYTLNTPFGPYENITIESASITPGTTYANLITTSFAGPNTFDIQAGPLGFSAFFGATDDDALAPALTGAPANLVPNANLTGSVTLLAGNVQVSSNTLTMAIVDGDPFGEAGDLELRVNIFFAGSEAVVIPEPTTASLLALGLAGLAIAGRARRSA